MDIDIKSVLSSQPVFADLSEKQLRRAASGAHVRHFKAGDYLWRAGDPVKSLCVVAKGLLQTGVVMRSGKSSIIEFFKPGDICGCLAYLRKRDALCDLRAVTDTIVICVPQQGLSFSFEALCRNIAARFERQILLRSICGETSRRRIPALLLWLYEYTGSSIPVTQAILAAVIGLSEETVCRALAPLKRKGLISLSRGFVTILCPQALERYLATV